MQAIADLYIKLEQLCLATPACDGWLLAWAQEGVAGKCEELGYGSRQRSLSRVRAARPGWECHQLALEIDKALKPDRRAAKKAAKAAKNLELAVKAAGDFTPITSDDFDHERTADAHLRQRKAYFCRSEGQRAKMRQMEIEE